MPKILIVDDEPKRYAALLEKLCASTIEEKDVSVVGNLKDAVQKLKIEAYDILVADMMIPESPWGNPIPEGGTNLLRYLEEDDELNRPQYIVGITSATDDDPSVKEFFDSHPWVLIRDNKPGENWSAKLEALVQQAIEAERRMDAVTYGVDVGLITALHSPEQEAVLEWPVHWSEPIPVDSATYVRTGTLSSNNRTLNLILGCCSRMGAVEAALLSAKLIQNYRPRMLVMPGICAGVESKTQYGDVIIGNTVWDYTSAKIIVDESGKKIALPSPDNIGIEREIIVRFELLRADEQLRSAIHTEWRGEKPRGAFAIHIGPSATGPAVIADGETFKNIRSEQNRDTVGLEMEAYGVYCAARMASRPRPVVFSAKSVCDYGDFLKDDRYQKYAAFTSAQTVYHFLTKFGSELKDIIDPR